MSIHLAALAASTLFVLAGPRPQGRQAQLQGIPLGDLVRLRPVSNINAPKPEVPTERNPAISQLTPTLGGSSGTASPTGTTGGSESTLGTPPGTTVGTPTTPTT
ncbi:MAG: hypothetical protein ACXVCV_21315, partial [Polyangia bacterium]